MRDCVGLRARVFRVRVLPEAPDADEAVDDRRVGRLVDAELAQHVVAGHCRRCFGLNVGGDWAVPTSCRNIPGWGFMVWEAGEVREGTGTAEDTAANA